MLLFSKLPRWAIPRFSPLLEGNEVGAFADGIVDCRLAGRTVHCSHYFLGELSNVDSNEGRQVRGCQRDIFSQSKHCKRADTSGKETVHYLGSRKPFALETAGEAVVSEYTSVPFSI